MDDDSSSIELIYEDSLGPIKIKEEEKDDEVGAEEEECVVIEENDKNENFIQDKDPMDLLELLEKRPTEEEEEPRSKETSDNEDESDSVATSISDNRSKGDIFSNFDWCFAETENSAYCLFCDVTLKTAVTYTLSKHQSSITHTERAEAYLAFLNQLNKDVYRLSSNRDFDGNVSEVKNHRQSLDEDFTNYLWDKWEEAHDWLIRTDTKFTAYCKYCHQKIGVGNSYLRKQHEEGLRHREFKSKAPRRRATFCGDLQSFQAENLTSELGSQKTATDDTSEKEPTSEWYEKSKSSADLCRCKLCDIKMFQTSFSRHTSSNLHRQNLSALDNPGVSDGLVKPDWATIQKDHEWLLEDPNDPMEAYCKYCKKRIAYGSSAAKRLIHEHSALHRAAVESFNDPVAESENTDEAEEAIENVENTEDYNGTAKDHDSKETSESEESNKSEESEDSRKKRSKRKKKYGSHTWAKPYKKDPRFLICQYCKVLLRKKVHKKKHEDTLRHQTAKKQYMDKLGSKALLKNQSEKPLRANETFYPWLVKFKDGIDYVFCTYCNFRFSRKANRLHHQQTKRHRDAEKEINALETQNQTPVKTPNAKDDSRKPKSPQATPAQLKKMKAKIMEWQERFAWLTLDKGHLLNYGYCTYCEKSVFMPSLAFASKHQRSSGHIRARIEIKRQEKSEQNTEDDQTEMAAEDGSERSSNSSDGPAAKRFRPSSLKTAIETAKRLTAAHLEMITFMQNNGQQKNDLLKKLNVFSTVQENQTVKQVPAPPSSPSVDSISAMSISRDPFDLFFNSTSESLKRLPADLASEGKLKVMQIIFDLEIRAQQRQNQTEVTITPNTSLNNDSVFNTKNETTLNDLLGIYTDEAAAVETLIPEQNQQQQNSQQQRQQHKQHSHQQNPQQQQQKNHNSQKHPHHQQQQQQQQQQQSLHQRSQNFYNIQAKAQNNSLLQQQLLQPQQPLPQQQRNLVLQAHLNSGGQIISSQKNSSPQRQRSIYYNQKSTNQVQVDNSQQAQHRVTNLNKLNFNNLNQRLNVNNSTMAFTNTSTSTPISTPSSSSSSSRYLASNEGTFVNDTRNNSVHPPPNKMPMIRPVPISSLTVKKYSPNNEPAFHHIQLNSSTQSKIIPLDTNKFTPR